MKTFIIICLSFLVSFSGLLGQTITKKSKPTNIKTEKPKPAEDDASIFITWINPGDTDSISAEKNPVLKIGFKSPSKLKNVNIFVNYEPLNTTRGLLVIPADELEDYDEVVETPIALRNGENTIKLIAETEDGRVVSEERVVNINYEDLISAEFKARKDYALLFATNEYDEWGNLTNPVNDAKTLAGELEGNYGFEVELLTNPTNSEIIDKLKEYARKSYLSQDQLFIFFAGHGYFDETFREGYVVTRNSQMKDNSRVTYISHSTLRPIINNIPSEHIFLAMDVCFGGTFDPTIANAGYRGGSMEMYDDVDNIEFIKRKLRFKTRRFLTSGGKEYVPDGRPGYHSPFARRLLEAFRSYGGSDRILTLPEMMTYVEKISPEPRFGEFGDNEPGSDFVFVAK